MVKTRTHYGKWRHIFNEWLSLKFTYSTKVFSDTNEELNKERNELLPQTEAIERDWKNPLRFKTSNADPELKERLVQYALLHLDSSRQEEQLRFFERANAGAKPELGKAYREFCEFNDGAEHAMLQEAIGVK